MTTVSCFCFRRTPVTRIKPIWWIRLVKSNLWNIKYDFFLTTCNEEWLLNNLLSSLICFPKKKAIIGLFHDSLLRFMKYFNILGGMGGLIYSMLFNVEAKIPVWSWASKMDLDQCSTFERKFKSWYIYKQIRRIIVCHTHCNIKINCLSNSCAL